MYSIGEVFFYEIEEKELEMHILGDIVYGGNEFLIAEDLDGERYAFSYDEIEEHLELISDEDIAEEMMEHWETTYYGGPLNEIGDWEDDEYYEREDHDVLGPEEDEIYELEDEF